MFLSKMLAETSLKGKKHILMGFFWTDLRPGNENNLQNCKILKIWQILAIWHALFEYNTKK